MGNKIRVSAVSYINAKPFVHGLQNADVLSQTILTLDHPAECARKLISDEADIGLVPVAAIEKILTAKIISDYCIAADGNVGSVLLLSNSPLEKIEIIILDYQSRTSVMLAKILAKYFWKINPEWLQENKDQQMNLNDGVGAVIIGDRALSMRGAYQYEYDLADEWKKFTGLPFVFACWVANKSINGNYISSFNNALKYGLNQRESIAQSLNIPNYDVRKYLTENIQFVMDDNKREGMNKFFELLKQV